MHVFTAGFTPSIVLQLNKTPWNKSLPSVVLFTPSNILSNFKFLWKPEFGRLEIEKVKGNRLRRSIGSIEGLIGGGLTLLK